MSRYNAQPIRERLLKYSIPEPNTGCVLWFGATDRNGYGGVYYLQKMRIVRRVAYELAKGAIPEGLEIDHKCRVRCCINPDHLEPVTPRENLRRSDSPSSLHAKKTHCRRGHEYSVENTRIYRGQRCCRQCQYERWHNVNGWDKNRRREVSNASV